MKEKIHVSKSYSLEIVFIILNNPEIAPFRKNRLDLNLTWDSYSTYLNN